jgi:hypothetical protein
MADNNRHPEQDPAEGSRETVERQLKETSDRGDTVRKPDMPNDGPRGGETNEAAKKPTV